MRQFLVLFILCFTSFGYSSEPNLKLEKIGLIGVKHIKDKGFVLISKSSEKDKIDVSFVNNQLLLAWSKSIVAEKPNHSYYNLIQVQATNSAIYVVLQYDQKIELSAFNIQSGSAYYISKKIPLTTDQDDVVWAYPSEEDLHFVFTSDSSLYSLPIVQSEIRAVEDLTTVKSPYMSRRFRPHFMHNNYLYASDMQVNETHQKLNVFISKTGLEEGMTLKAEIIELQLNNHSFTYTSADNDQLFYMQRTASAFYIYGKMDIQFNTKYPKQRVGSGIVGVWVAKINFNLELEYFQEIPFSEFEGIISRNTIHKPSIIEIKEDLNHNLFMNINELAQVMYGDMHIMYLDSTGYAMSLLSGQDQFHFFEYDKQGLRESGRKNHLLLVNDDWSHFSANYLHLIRYVDNMHSKVIKEINNLAVSSNETQDNICYSFFSLAHDTIILEYTSQKRGSLLFYRSTGD